MGIKENIKILRDKYNLSQKDFAKIAGVTDKAVSSWEKGTKEPRMGAIQKIADYFNIQKSNIIEDYGMSTSSQGWYLDPETAKAAQEMYDKHRVLFDASRKLKPESIKEVEKFIEYQLAKENHENED
jgi:Predicted transcriptional regulator with C-terminal CBS domains